jgi:tetratricopeptide (TPR) repeat protein
VDVGRRAGLSLSNAGRRAQARGDVQLAGDLFGRAIDLIPDDDPERARIELELAQVRIDQGDFDLALAAARSIASGRRVVSVETRWLATLTSDRLGFFRGESAEVGIPNARAAIEAAGRAGLDRVSWAGWRTLGEVAQAQGHLAEATRNQRQALTFARRAGDRRAEAETQLELGGYSLMDMTPVSEAIARATEIRDWARANGQTWPEAVATTQIGRAVAMAGRFDEGRQLVADGIAIIRELGLLWHAATTAWYTGLVEFLAGDYAAAAAVLEPAYTELTALSSGAPASYTAAQLSRMLFLVGRYDAAEDYVGLAERHWPSERSNYDMASGTARSLLLSRAGRNAEAEAAARTWLARVEPTDLFLARAFAHQDLAAVLEAVDRRTDAESHRAAAIGIYERKGVFVLAERLRRSASPTGG